MTATGSAAAAGMFGARAVAFAPDGSLYAMERQGSSIRRVRDGVIDTVAGTGERGYAGDGGDARQAVFTAPKEMAVDPRRQYLRRRHREPCDPPDRRADLDRHHDRRPGTAGPGGDGGPAISRRPSRVRMVRSVGSDGTVYSAIPKIIACASWCNSDSPQV